MQITITDEIERDLIHCVLWKSAYQSTDEVRFSDRLYEHGWSSIDPMLGSPPKDIDPTEDLTRMLRHLDQVRAASDRLKEAAVGAVVEIPMDAAELDDHLRSCMLTISDREDFWNLERDQQNRWMEAHDAAWRMRQKHAVAEAVA